MAKIRFADPDVPFVRLVDMLGGTPNDAGTPAELVDAAARIPDAEQWLTEHRALVAESDDGLQLFEIRFGAGLKIKPHAHATSEIIYVLEGELLFGSKRCGAGAAVYIPADQVYSFVVGDDGCRFLNFRASPGYSLIYADEG